MTRRLSMDFQPLFMAGLSLRKRDRSHWQSVVQPNVVPPKRPSCSVCGFVAETKRGLIHADEVWSFPGFPKVVLVDVRPLCVTCHEAKDYAELLRRILTGKASASRAANVMNRYCDLNGCSAGDFDEDVKAALGAKNHVEKLYQWGFNGGIEVDYGRWDRPAETPRLTDSEKRSMKNIFAHRDEPIVLGGGSLNSFAQAVKYLQSLPLGQRESVMSEIEEAVASERDGDDVVAERDEGIQFS